MKNILSKPGFYDVTEQLRFLSPLTSPHTVHKDSIESPWTPDTIHYFQAWNPHRSTLRTEWENGLLLQICSLALSWSTHIQTVACFRYMEPPSLKKLGLDVPQRSLLQPLWSHWAQVLPVRLSYHVKKSHSSRFIFEQHIWKDLLDSALTLSISPSRVTSLSIKLEKKRTCCDYEAIPTTKEAATETQQNHWMTEQKSCQLFS